MTTGENNMENNLEIKEILEEIKDMLIKSIDPKPEELTDEEISKGYESDNEEEDKWDNMEKACWSGYTQRGMKEKNGRMVPNCVPVEKAYDAEDKEEEPKIKKSIWDGTFLK